jgi:competence protein ComEA
VQPVDINRANEDELRALPGIGGVLAARIVEAREREGPFASLDDLRRVRGLGRAKLERLATAIAVSP